MFFAPSTLHFLVNEGNCLFGQKSNKNLIIIDICSFFSNVGETGTAKRGDSAFEYEHDEDVEDSLLTTDDQEQKRRLKQLEFPADRCDLERGEIECPPLSEHDQGASGGKLKSSTSSFLSPFPLLDHNKHRKAFYIEWPLLHTFLPDMGTGHIGQITLSFSCSATSRSSMTNFFVFLFLKTVFQFLANIDFL